MWKIRLAYGCIIIIYACLIRCSASAKFDDKECEEMQNSTANCSCRKTSLVYLIKCGHENENKHIDIEILSVPKDYMQLECRQVGAGTYSLLPNITLGKWPYLQMLNCPLDAEQAIYEIIERLGITDIHTLYYEIDAAHQATAVAVPSRNNFKGLSSLKQLELSFSTLKEVPADLLLDLSELTCLNVSSNGSLEILPLGFFAAQHKLTDLHLSKNYLSHLHVDLFANATSITTLDLSSNRLGNLPENIFGKLTVLHTLRLDGNRLHSVPANIFQNNQFLSHLQLNDNKLEVLAANLMWQQFELITLDLSNNQLLELPANFFKKTAKLQELNLARNYLSTAISAVVAPLFGAKTDSAREKSPMRNFNLSHNRLGALSCANLSNLTYVSQRLDVSHNNISWLDLDCMKHNSAQIVLDNNPLKCDCKLLEFVQFLRVLNRTNVSSIRMDITNLSCAGPSGLEGVPVSKVRPQDLLCPVVEAPFCMVGCNCWQRRFDLTLIVNCTLSGITAVPALPDLNSIKTPELNFTGIELIIESNNLSQLPSKDHKGYVFVQSLQAAFNNLTAIEADNLPPNLRVLDVRHNKLRRVSDSVVDYLYANHKLQHITIVGNPLICDCKAQHLLQFMDHRVFSDQNITHDFNNVSCANTHHLRKLHEIRNICPRDLVLLIVLMALSAAGFLIGSFIAFYYKYRCGIKLWLYMSNCCCGILRWLVFRAEKYDPNRFGIFISCAPDDEPFVMEYIYPTLSKNFSVRIMALDALGGGVHIKQAASFIEHSQRTVVVLTENYINSEMSHFEFQQAHLATMNEGCQRVILLKCGKIDDTKSLDPELRTYLKGKLYIEWGSKRFWPEFFFQLPHQRTKLEIVSGAEQEKEQQQLTFKSTIEKHKPPLVSTAVTQADKNPVSIAINCDESKGVAEVEQDLCLRGVEKPLRKQKIQKTKINAIF